MLAGLKKIITLRQNAEMAAADLPALMMQARLLAQSIHHGEHPKRKDGSGEEFWQYREYVQGDRPQDIDWRQSGKTDHIYIRQKELHITRKTFFWCASDRGMAYSSDKKLATKQETAQIICLALALLMARANEQIGYFGSPKTGHNETHLQNLGLAMTTEKKHFSLPPVNEFSIPRSASFVAAGDFLSPLNEIEKNFEQLSTRGAQSLIIQILDPSELALDFDGRIQFEGLQAQDKEIIDHIPSVRDEYQDRIKAHLAGLQNLCRKYGWHYVLHSTQDNIGDMLAALWQHLEAENMRA